MARFKTCFTITAVGELGTAILLDMSLPLFFSQFPWAPPWTLRVCVCVCISYVSNVWEWRMFKTGMNSMCLHPPRTPSPVMSMQKQMASCGDA